MSETVEDGMTGLIVEPGNAAELTEAVTRLLENRIDDLSMGSRGAAKKVSLEFDPFKVAKQNLEVYHAAIIRSLPIRNDRF